LGGLSSSNIQPKQVINDETKKAVNDLIGEDDDYLLLPGQEKTRPRSAVFTHTIGTAVLTGGFLGGSYGVVRNFKPATISSSIERSQMLTNVVRGMRNNAIRFGHLGTLFCTSGIILEKMLREAPPPEPSEEEIFQMQAKGIPYVPPVQKPLDDSQNQNITTLAFLLTAVGLSVPKSIELWRNAGKMESFAAASQDAGIFEAQIMKMYGRTTNLKSSQIPQALRTIAVTKVVGFVGLALLGDYIWRSQLKDKANRKIRSFSSSMY